MFKSKIEKIVDKTIEELTDKISGAVDAINKHPEVEDYVKELDTILDQLSILNEIKRKAKSK